MNGRSVDFSLEFQHLQDCVKCNEVHRLVGDKAQHSDDHAQTSARLADLEDQIRFARQRADGIHEKISTFPQKILQLALSLKLLFKKLLLNL